MCPVESRRFFFMQEQVSTYHKGRPSDVLANLQLFGDDVKGRNEELITDDGQCDEHVNETGYVEDYRSVTPLLHRKKVVRKVGVLGALGLLFGFVYIVGYCAVEPGRHLQECPRVEGKVWRWALKEQDTVHTIEGFFGLSFVDS